MSFSFVGVRGRLAAPTRNTPCSIDHATLGPDTPDRGRRSLAPCRTPRHLRRGAIRQGACIVRPRHIEGPYFVDAGLNRSDIRSDPKTGATKYGVPLRLTFRVSQLHGRTCLPLTGAQVDVWHCDADGLYSDTKEWQASTLGQRFLRGYQITDRKGLASFTTIFPGWYPEPRRAHPLQDPHRGRRRARQGIHFADLFRRRADRRDPRAAAVRAARRAQGAKRPRSPLSLPRQAASCFRCAKTRKATRARSTSRSRR